MPPATYVAGVSTIMILIMQDNAPLSSRTKDFWAILSMRMESIFMLAYINSAQPGLSLCYTTTIYD